MSKSAAVIAVANSKGGCGKSTTILILAGGSGFTRLSRSHHRRRPQKAAFEMGAGGREAEAITVSEADSATMRDEIEKARTLANVVLIDVEGCGKRRPHACRRLCQSCYYSRQDEPAQGV